jgi:hypothetical protein
MEAKLSHHGDPAIFDRMIPPGPIQCALPESASGQAQIFEPVRSVFIDPPFDLDHCPDYRAAPENEVQEG